MGIHLTVPNSCPLRFVYLLWSSSGAVSTSQKGAPALGEFIICSKPRRTEVLEASLLSFRSMFPLVL